MYVWEREMGVLKADTPFRTTLSESFGKGWQESDSEQYSSAHEGEENKCTSYFSLFLASWLFFLLCSMAFFSYIFWALAQTKNYLQMVHLKKEVTDISIKSALNTVIITWLPWRVCCLSVFYQMGVACFTSQARNGFTVLQLFCVLKYLSPCVTFSVTINIFCHTVPWEGL